RMQGLMSALVGHATEVKVYDQEEGSVLCWEADPGGDNAWIEVELAEKGWGTNVKVSAENGGGGSKLEGWLDAGMEEPSFPEKRPFDGLVWRPPDSRSWRRLASRSRARGSAPSA